MRSHHRSEILALCLQAFRVVKHPLIVESKKRFVYVGESEKFVGMFKREILGLHILSCSTIVNRGRFTLRKAFNQRNDKFL